MSTIKDKTLKKVDKILDEIYDLIDEGEITLTDARLRIRLCEARVKTHREDRLRNGVKIGK